MTEGAADPSAPAPEDAATKDREGPLQKTEHLLLDELSERLDTLKLFRAGDDDRADEVLEQFGARGKVEAEMLEQLSERAPLRYPDRFEEAHRTTMRALEVFDRNGARDPSNLGAGFLNPIASFLVQKLIRLIVRDYQKRVIEQIRKLYGRREANAVKGSPEFNMLRLARLQADRLAPTFQSSSVGLPTFLVGGAAVSGLGSLLQELGVSAAHNAIVLLAVTGVLLLLALGAGWCILKAAGIARRRTRIALDQPLRALWETIGAAGHPPRDESRQFAIYAALLLLLVWIVVPVAITVAIRLR